MLVPGARRRSSTTSTARCQPASTGRPEQVLADPKVIDNVLTSTKVITGVARRVGNTTYSDEFNKHFVCPDLNTPLSMAR